ncbi:MAG TPA: hypothetical protein PKE17_00200 [Saprospiraceae bacterium]|nr:hypothetical protein [Saprospiraceae bacterium]
MVVANCLYIAKLEAVSWAKLADKTTAVCQLTKLNFLLPPESNAFGKFSAYPSHNLRFLF